MTDERRYREDEVGEIFALAASEAEVARPVISEQHGLTLAELQAVGEEVGLPAARVAAAATTLESRGQVVPRKSVLGTPVAVGRVVELPREATDREWELLVTELRETFGARGTASSLGGIREWANGNLHAFIEPTTSGYRLRLGTHKRAALVLSGIGAVGFVMGLALLITAGLDAVTFGPTLAALIPAVMALVGGTVAAANRGALRRWADEREHQMEHVARRTTEMLSGPEPE